MELKEAIFEDWKSVIPPVWRVVATVIVAAVAVIVGGWVWLSRNVAEQKHVQSQTAGEEQQRQIVQRQENHNLQLQQQQDEALKKSLSTPTPEDPAEIVHKRFAANMAGQYERAQSRSMRYDAPPGSDCTILEHDTYTDSNGIKWKHQKYTDAQGLMRESFEPQIPEQFVH